MMPGERMIELYGEQVSNCSEAYKEACEARMLLGYPIDRRRLMINQIVTKRGRGDPAVEYQVRKGVQDALVKEWEFRSGQKWVAP